MSNLRLIFAFHEKIACFVQGTNLRKQDVSVFLFLKHFCWGYKKCPYKGVHGCMSGLIKLGMCSLVM